MRVLRNQHGFSALEVALFVIVMGIVGGSGYYVVQKTQSDKPQEETTQQMGAQTEQATVTQECAVENKEKIGITNAIGGKQGFDFCLPKGWHLYSPGGNDFYYANLEGMTYDAATDPQIETVGGSDGMRQFFMSYTKTTTSKTHRDIQKLQKVAAPPLLDTSQDLTIEAYYHLTANEDPIGAGIDFLPQGTKQYYYLITDTRNTSSVLISYMLEPEKVNLLSLVESVAASVSPTDHSL